MREGLGDYERLKLHLHFVINCANFTPCCMEFTAKVTKRQKWNVLPFILIVFEWGYVNRITMATNHTTSKCRQERNVIGLEWTIYKVEIHASEQLRIFFRKFYFFGRTRCEICRLVDEGDTFADGRRNRKYYINYNFDCDSNGVFSYVKDVLTKHWKHNHIV